MQAARLKAEELTPGRDALAADEEKRRSQTIPGLLLSLVEAALNEVTAARPEIEQVSQSAAHFPNHAAPATSSVSAAGALASALDRRLAKAGLSISWLLGD